MDLECIETDYQSIKAQRKAAGELEVRIRNNAWMIPNCAERRRYGGRYSFPRGTSASKRGISRGMSSR